MLVAGLLVALRLGACKDTSGYTHRHELVGGLGVFSLMNGASVSVPTAGEACNNYNSATPLAAVDYYDGPDACLVADAHKCCTVLPTGGTGAYLPSVAFCIDASEELCTAESTVWVKHIGSPGTNVTTAYRWCGASHGLNGNDGLAAGVAVGSAAFVVLLAATAAT
jgi:hypothetical protein